MKDKIFNFIKEKKEILIFLGIVALVFATVILISQIANRKAQPVANTTQSTTGDQTPKPPVTKEEVKEKMIRPLTEENFDISRQFYSGNGVLAVDAVINDNGIFYESYGISYSTMTNEKFDCVAVFSGIVTDVSNDSKHNSIITIKHDNDIIAKYYSINEPEVSINDQVSQGQKIGSASASSYDNEAGIHVHLELFVLGERINPTLAIGKTILEIKELD